MRNLFILCISATIALCGCGGKRLPTPAETVATLQEIQELATVEYTISKVVKASDNQTWYKIGDRKILITCEATVKAGIDMKAVTEKNIVTSGKTIRIQLPPPKVLSVNLPPEGIQVAFEEVSFFRKEFTSAERDDLLKQAEDQIRNSSSELGILTQAKTNSQLFLSKFLLQLGFEKVEISFESKERNSME